jgi:hypothetical protein
MAPTNGNHYDSLPNQYPSILVVTIFQKAVKIIFVEHTCLSYRLIFGAKFDVVTNTGPFLKEKSKFKKRRPIQRTNIQAINHT